MLPLLLGFSLIQKYSAALLSKSLTNPKNLFKNYRVTGTVVITIDEKGHLVEDAWEGVPIYIIKFLYELIPWCITAVIVARDDCRTY